VRRYLDTPNAYARAARRESQRNMRFQRRVYQQ
jgi:hypothetical protein